jgi:predicted peroxiredoxin
MGDGAMARIVVMATYGPDNVGRANAAFQIASAAVDEGHQVAMILELDGTLLVKDPIIQNAHGLGLTPVRELYPKLVRAGVPIYV